MSDKPILPLVSTIMPAYNHAAYVEQAILSVAAQNYPSQELVIIDDGSTDDTRRVIERTLAKLDPNFLIQFSVQTNVGLCRTLNRGLAMARGEFVQFLASDDAYLPQKTSICAEALNSHEKTVAAVYCDGYVTDDELKVECAFSELYPVPLCPSVHRELLVANWIPAMGLMYRKDAVVEAGGFDETLKFEDWDLLIRLSGRFAIVRLRPRLFLYRLHGSNMHSNRQLMNEASAAIIDKVPEMKQFQAFTAAVKRKSFKNAVKLTSLSNIDLLVRHAIRRAQIRMRPSHFNLLR